ncbi:MAG TPA: hypothetical protein VLQ66_04950 [Paenisporosarcina sp.]|nr:hypothetical protein [Paenisporosarcina sp.]
MTKIEIMDKYLSSLIEKISTSEICKIVYEVFGIDLDIVLVLDKGITYSRQVPSLTNIDTSISSSQARVAIDSYLNQYGNDMTGVEIRNMLNHIFGINLDGISSLERERISLYSKGQWIIQNDKDLFLVRTGTKDVYVEVVPTEYFSKQTGLEMLPDDLQHALANLGFQYDEKIKGSSFANPNGQALPDKFKGQTFGAIIEVINRLYSHI